MREVFLYRVMSCCDEELKAATMVGGQFILLIRLKCFLWNVRNLTEKGDLRLYDHSRLRLRKGDTAHCYHGNAERTAEP